MGEVYRAQDSRLERDVAVKVLPEHLLKNPQALARFVRETKAVAALSHPNLLAIFDTGAENGISYAVTELLQGESLRASLMRGPMPWRKAVEIGAALAEGLAAAHSKGITHRDLKPENIFLTLDGRVKVLDFGLARVESPRTVDGAETQTEAGTLLGTPGYMSPEQVRGASAGPASDIFSLGCVLYEMVSGRRAFPGQTAAETMSSILRDTPGELAASGAQVPPELDRLILCCLEKNSEARFQSAHDLAFHFKAILIAPGGAPQSPRAIDSIAVLPFTNASNDPDTEYLCDGITESILNSLAQIAQLRVTPRSTAFRYRASDVDPQMVGRELNVRVVLTGRVIQRGDSLVVSAELMDVAAGSQLWGERYHRKLSDIFALEAEIASKISESLRMKLSGQEKSRLSKRFTEDPEAYQLYLRGRHQWTRRTPDHVKKGAEYFQKAIEKDPSYAIAYSGLADCYSILGVYSILPSKEALATCAERLSRSADWVMTKVADTQAQAAIAKRLRARLDTESSPDPGDYEMLWSLEFRSRPPAEHPALRKQVAKDVERLLASKPDKRFMGTLLAGVKQSGASKEDVTAFEDRVLKETPASQSAYSIANDRWKKDHKEPEDHKDTAAWEAWQHANRARRNSGQRSLPTLPGWKTPTRRR